MGKIYRRPTLRTNDSPKKKDEKRRVRNVVMNFRVSPEEKDRIALSGLMKSEYFINSCLGNQIVTYVNVRTFEKMRQALVDIKNHLKRVERTDELDPIVMEQLLMILEIYQGLER